MNRPNQWIGLRGYNGTGAELFAAWRDPSVIQTCHTE